MAGNVHDTGRFQVYTNNHTQPVVYLIGKTAAEKLIKEYGPNGTKSTQRALSSRNGLIGFHVKTWIWVYISFIKPP